MESPLRACRLTNGRASAVDSLEPLIAALGDADPAVRAEVARALSRLGNVTAVP